MESTRAKLAKINSEEDSKQGIASIKNVGK